MKKAAWTLNPDALIDDEEFGKLLKANRAYPRIHLALLIAGNLGWRIGEVVHLRVEDILWKKHELKKLVLKKTGKDRDRRVVKPMGSTVEAALRKFVGKRSSGWIFEGVGKKCDVFPDHKGRCPAGHISKRALQLEFKEACKRAKLTDAQGRGLHALRHCFALRAANQLDNPWQLRDLLDHNSVETSGVYVDIANQGKLLKKVGEVSGR